MRTVFERDPWSVSTRINRAGNLALEIKLHGAWHAEVILQEEGIVDLGTKAKPWPLGEKGWEMPGAPNPALRKYRFTPGGAP